MHCGHPVSRRGQSAKRTTLSARRGCTCLDDLLPSARARCTRGHVFPRGAHAGRRDGGSMVCFLRPPVLAPAAVSWPCEAAVACPFGGDIFQRLSHQHAVLLTVLLLLSLCSPLCRWRLQLLGVRGATPFRCHPVLRRGQSAKRTALSTRTRGAHACMICCPLPGRSARVGTRFGGRHMRGAS